MLPDETVYRCFTTADIEKYVALSGKLEEETTVTAEFELLTFVQSNAHYLNRAALLFVSMQYFM